MPLAVNPCDDLAQTCAIMDLADLRTHFHHLPALCAPAPLLHTLRLSIYRRRMAAPSFSPDSLFGGAAGLIVPNLRHLRVLAWELESWAPLLLAQLSSRSQSERSVTCVAQRRLIFSVLGRMRAFEQLSLTLDLEDADGVPLTTLLALRDLMLFYTLPDALRRGRCGG